MPFTSNIPKCLVFVGGKPILYYQLRSLEMRGINKIAIVAGYQADKIKKYVRKNFPRLDVTFFLNDKYAATNDIYSFYLAKDFCNRDFIQIDSDVLFHPQILTKLLHNSPDLSATCIRKAKCGAEEMKVFVDSGGKVKKISKNLQPNETIGEFMSISLFSKKFADKLFPIMKSIIENVGPHIYSGEAIDQTIKNGYSMRAVDIGIYSAIEIDFPEDIKEAEKKILPKIIYEF